MCGLTGIVSPSATRDELLRDVRSMCSAIVHRGPDDAGEWIDDHSGVALGFRRLAVIDLSPAGHQPMVSDSGRFIATLNGEIYNFEALRHELRAAGLAPPFRGHSDTEVMLAAFEAWGVAGAVSRFNGMFAIVVWDRSERRLKLVRDRMGVKPLYYGFTGRTFLYGSELKALRRHPDFRAQIDREAVHMYTRYMYVPTPLSIYEGISKLVPGTILTLNPADGQTETTVYWSVKDSAMRGLARPFRGSEDDAAEQLGALVRDSVGIRMVADVPVGVFLSGGIDSSLVTALMQSQSSTPVHSFSIGFSDALFNEAPYAKAVAAHLGTRHTELYMTTDDVTSVIPSLPAMYDEPFADSSQMPTHLVSKLARKSVTVSLSGDGGDELFGGYARYFIGQNLYNRIGRVPEALRPAFAGVLHSVPAKGWDRIFGAGQRLLPKTYRRSHYGERLHKLARVLRSTDPDEMYFEVVTSWGDVIHGTKATAPVERRDQWPSIKDPIDRMMYFDQISYLPDDILTKVDRASMAVSLEAREPLLDYRLVEFAWSLPLAMKVRNGEGKRALRRVLYQYVPRTLIDRPKMGFGVPIETWLRGPLRDWAESLLSRSELDRYGLLHTDSVLSTWKEHLSGTNDWQSRLWTILMLQAWLREERAEATCDAGTPTSLSVGPRA